MGSLTIGVDIGQRVDPTAIAVVERAWRATAWHGLVRHLERLPLGTPYPAVAARVAAVAAGAGERAGAWPTLYLDATGCGQPVVDTLRAAGVRADLVAVYFTHGDRRTEDRERAEVKLGKAYLVSRMQALLQGGRLHLPKTAEAEALAAELLDYEIRVDEQANDRYGAFRTGRHDDLVTALGLCVQSEPELPGVDFSTPEGRRLLGGFGGKGWGFSEGRPPRHDSSSIIGKGAIADGSHRIIHRS